MILIKLFHVTFKAFFTLTSSGEVKSYMQGLRVIFCKLRTSAYTVPNRFGRN